MLDDTAGSFSGQGSEINDGLGYPPNMDLGL